MDHHVDQEEAEQVERGKQVEGREEGRHLYKESSQMDRDWMGISPVG